MARLAPPYAVITDVVNLGDLEDSRPFTKPYQIPWAEGDAPLWESVDLDELPNEVLKFKICRSFRADLRHKLTLIIRAHGGYGNGGVNATCARLGVKRVTLYRWLVWKNSPGHRHLFERIDTAYEEAVQFLVAKKMAKSKRKCASS